MRWKLLEHIEAKAQRGTTTSHQLPSVTGYQDSSLPVWSYSWVGGGGGAPDQETKRKLCMDDWYINLFC